MISRFLVTRNCDAVLRRVRSRYYTKHVWIDLICISQSDIEERGHQVDLMPQIYTRARKTYIYTGQAMAQSDASLRSLADDACRSADQGKTPKSVRSDLLTSFLRRPYFLRVWVVQEIALSRKPVTLDKNEIPWSILLNSSAVTACPVPKPLLSLGCRRLRNPDELIDLLRLGRHCQSSDPKNKGFALWRFHWSIHRGAAVMGS